MNAMPSIVTERMDDIPLLVAQMRRMDVPFLIDSYFVAHGNREGLSLGWTATVACLAPQAILGASGMVYGFCAEPHTWGRAY